jgi:hypothetical protein
VAPVIDPTRRELLQLSAAAAIESTAGACSTGPDTEPMLQIAARVDRPRLLLDVARRRRRLGALARDFLVGGSER